MIRFSRVIDALSSSIIAISSFLVRAERRAEWREEWEAELWTLRGNRDRGTLNFAVGAPLHALSMWTPDLLLYELRHAWRAIIKAPAASLSIALLLAIGAGAPTTVFTIIDSTLLRAPGGVRDNDSLVQFGRGTVATDFDNYSHPAWQFFRDNSNTLIDVAAYATETILVGAPTGERAVPAEVVTANYFDVVGARMRIGRDFFAEEELGANVIVLSHEFWQREFGGDSRALGRAVSVRGVPFQIIGVADADFRGARIGGEAAQLWVPLGAIASISPGMRNPIGQMTTSWLWTIGRVRDGVPFEAVRAELDQLNTRLQADRSVESREGIQIIRGAGLRPDERVLAYRVTALLAIAVIGVLLIACFNMVAMLMVRGAARSGELAIRASLGATQSRLNRQLVLETLVLGALGGAMAYAISIAASEGIQRAFPWDLTVTIEPNSRTLVFALICGIATAIAFGAWPAWRSSRANLQSLLRRTSTSLVGSRSFFRSAIVTTQILISCVLVAGTALMVRSVITLAMVDPGFESQGSYIVPLQYRSDDVPISLYDRILAHGDGTAIAATPLLSGSIRSRTVWPDGMTAADGINAVNNRVSASYFDALNIPLLRGRTFDATGDGTEPVAIITRTLANQFFGSIDVIGRRITTGTFEGPLSFTITGVAEDVRARSLRELPGPVIFTSILQDPSAQFVVHSRATAQTIGALTDAIRALDAGLVVLPATPYDERIARSIADLRVVAGLCGIIGLVAIVLAFIGLYALVGQALQSRAREFALRMALGAKPSSVGWLILRYSIGHAAIGTTLGVIATMAALPALQPWLHDAEASALIITLTTALFVLGTACAAATIPAVRAMRVAPITLTRGGS